MTAAMTIDIIQTKALAWLAILQGWLASPQFYAQVIAIVAAWIAAKIVARAVIRRVALLREEPTEGRFLRYQRLAFSCRSLIEPALFVVLLMVAASVQGFRDSDDMGSFLPDVCACATGTTSRAAIIFRR